MAEPSGAQAALQRPCPLPASRCTAEPSDVFHRKVSSSSPPAVAASEPSGEKVPHMTVLVCPAKRTRSRPETGSRIAAPNLGIGGPPQVYSSERESAEKLSEQTSLSRP